jgi:hypothetical protein
VQRLWILEALRGTYAIFQQAAWISRRVIAMSRETALFHVTPYCAGVRVAAGVLELGRSSLLVWPCPGRGAHGYYTDYRWFEEADRRGCGTGVIEVPSRWVPSDPGAHPFVGLSWTGEGMFLWEDPSELGLGAPGIK